MGETALGKEPGGDGIGQRCSPGGPSGARKESAVHQAALRDRQQSATASMCR